jgi:hypothetical protein
MCTDKILQSVTYPKLLQDKHVYLGGYFEIDFRKKRRILFI